MEEYGTKKKGYNLELYKVYNKPDITRFIKVKSLEWAGPLIRASVNRMVKKVVNIKGEGTRKI